MSHHCVRISKRSWNIMEWSRFWDARCFWKRHCEAIKCHKEPFNLRPFRLWWRIFTESWCLSGGNTIENPEDNCLRCQCSVNHSTRSIFIDFLSIRIAQGPLHWRRKCWELYQERQNHNNHREDAPNPWDDSAKTSADHGRFRLAQAPSTGIPTNEKEYDSCCWYLKLYV